MGIDVRVREHNIANPPPKRGGNTARVVIGVNDFGVTQYATLDLTDPQDFADYVRSVFESNGLGDQGEFAVMVASGESSLNQNVGPVAEPPGGFSHGPWMLYEKGLLQDFYSWAARSGYKADPYDPIASTAFVAQYIAGNGPEGWKKWSAANSLLAQGITPTGATGREEFPSEAELRRAQAGLTREQTLTEPVERERLRQVGIFTGEQAESERFERRAEPLRIQQESQQMLDRRREAAVNALVNALPFLAKQGQFFPGREPYGAASVLGRTLGAYVPPERVPTTTLPLNALVNASFRPTPADIARILGQGR